MFGVYDNQRTTVYCLIFSLYLTIVNFEIMIKFTKLNLKGTTIKSNKISFIIQIRFIIYYKQILMFRLSSMCTSLGINKIKQQGIQLEFFFYPQPMMT